jgi:hypothetical protein
MFIIMSQKIDYESNYDDIPFKIYHYPKRYRNQIKTGNPFIYYQGDRYKRQNRYYFGCGIVGEITISENGEDYYAEILNGVSFPKKVPIYNPEGGFIESLGYSEIRKKENPPWQNSIRKVSENAFKTIIERSGLDYDELTEILRLNKDFQLDTYDKSTLGKMETIVKEEHVEYFLESNAEEEIEKFINNLDSSGSLELKEVLMKTRVASRKTISTLKSFYNHTCQICGENHFERYSVNVVEAHHIEYFSRTQNHQLNNIIILCPTHHRLLHAGGAVFNRNSKIFVYENGYEEGLKINKHL